jgi:soluble lytic murein transglycosylase
MKCQTLPLFFLFLAFPVFAQQKVQAPSLQFPLAEIQKAVSASDASLALRTFQKNTPLEIKESLHGQFVEGYLSKLAGKDELSKSKFELVVQSKGGLAPYAAHLLGKLSLRGAKLAEARKFFELADGMNPQEKLWNENALELIQLDIQDKNWLSVKRRLSVLEKNLRRETEYPKVLWLKAQADDALGNKDQFCQSLRKLYTNFPHFAAITAWGYDLSANEFQGRKTGCGWDDTDFRQRVRMLVFHGEHDEADKEVGERRKVLSLTSPFDADFLYGQYLLQIGEAQRALKIVQPYIESQKNSEKFQLFMASVFARSGEHSAAVGIYDRLSKETRGHMGVEYKYRAGILCYQTQDYDCATARFKEIAKSKSSSRQTLESRWHLAWIAYLKGRYTLAFEELQRVPVSKKSSQLTTFQKRVVFWKAVTQVKLKKFEDARADFGRLLKVDPTGFYGLASQARLSQLDVLAPKKSELTLAEQNRQKLLKATLNLFPSLYAQQGTLGDISAGTASAEAEVAAEAEKGEIAIQEWEDTDVPVAGNEGGALEMAEVSSDSKELSQSQVGFENSVLNVRVLAALGLEEWARWELYSVEKTLPRNSASRIRLVKEYEAIKMYHRSSLMAQRLWSGKLDSLTAGERELAESSYPLAYQADVDKYSKEFDVPMEFILSIMRAESSYRAQATSPVGALGLMQVMPQTGRRVADMLREKQFEPKSLLQPYQGIRYGSRYMARLLGQFNRNIVLASAAYNAGPHRVKQWVTQFGELEVDEFIEHIPFVETRNYVKKVLAFTLIYRTVYPEIFRTRINPIPNLAATLNFRFEGIPPTREIWDDI